MDLSIIIPVWNEASKIVKDILNIEEHFKNKDLICELIIVDDGSTDRSVEVAEEMFKMAAIPAKVIRCRHFGKGHAVRQGVITAKGQIIMFMDCGANVPLTFIDSGMHILKENRADIVLGTRYHAQSQITYDMIWFRKITSFIFRIFTKVYLDLPKNISDSQCGFKLFKGEPARKLFNEIRSDGFLFDLEMILLAGKENFRLTELPLEWCCDRDSRLNIIHSLRPVLKELTALKKI